MNSGHEIGAPSLRARALAAVAPEANASARRGWLYRLLGVGPEASVLVAGEVDLGPWFAKVSVVRKLAAADHSARYDLVVLHAALGGCRTVDESIDRAARCLAPRGMVALTAANAWRSAAALSGVPRGTPVVLRRAMRRAGLSNVATYFVRPDPSSPVWLIDAAPSSAMPFLAADAEAARASGRTLASFALATFAALGIAGLRERWMLVTGRAC